MMRLPLSLRKLLPVLLVFLACCALSGCKKADTVQPSPDTLEGFHAEGVSVGVPDGYIFEEVVDSTLPYAQKKVFADRESAYRGLLAGQVDGVADDEATIRAMMRSTDVFSVVDGYLFPSDYAFAFPKNERGEMMAAQMNTFIQTRQGNGTISALDEKWFGDDPSVKHSEDASSLPGPNGTVTIAYDPASIPFTYLSADQPTGYEVDLLIEFCREYGYQPVFTVTSFQDMLSGTAYGTYDLGCGGITVTEKRAENHIFSTPHYTGGITLCIRSGEAAATEDSSQHDLTRHFRAAFLEDKRYLIFLTGIFFTVAITAIAAFFGTPLAVLFFYLSNRTPILVRQLTKGFLWVMQGIPAVMLLMLFFYTWYRDMYGGGFLCAVVAFTLLFASEWQRVISRYGKAVADGRLLRDYRTEAINTRTFFRILHKKRGAVLREDFADRLCLLLKASSLVGYINVTDMTGAFERIRMDSYETMLPLICTTIVYFILIKLICLVVRRKPRP